MEEFEYQGWWWLPNEEMNQEDAVAGILSFSIADGLKLQLFGNLDNKSPTLQSLLSGNYSSFDLIHGHTSDKNRCVTLCGCSVIRSDASLSSPDRGTLVLRCTVAYIGHEWLTEVEEDFAQVSVSYSYLLDWVEGAGFKRTKAHPGEQAKSLSISYEVPEPLTGQAADYQVSLDRVIDEKLSYPLVTLQERALFSISHSVGLSLTEWLSRCVKPLQYLLSLAIDRPTSVQNLSVVVEVEKDESSKANPAKTPLRVIYQPVSNVEQETRLADSDTLFLLKDTEMVFGDLIAKWFALYDSYNIVCDLYFSARHSPRPFLSGRFLVLAQAAEIFHRQRFPGGALLKDEFKQRRKEIVDSVPEALQGWTKEKLTWSNELTLKERIKKLYDHTARVMNHLVDDRDSFVKLVGDTRNYYTHFGSGLQKRAAEGEELHYLAEALRYMLAACLLLELGFTEDRIEELFLRNRRFQHLCKGISSFKRS